MSDSAITTSGRRHAVVIAWILVITEVVVDVGYFLGVGPDKVVQHAVRLVLLLLVVRALFAGHPWARWTLVVLLTLGLLMGSFVIAEHFRAGNLAVGAVAALPMAAYAVAVMLLLSRPLAEFTRGR